MPHHKNLATLFLLVFLCSCTVRGGWPRFKRSGEASLPINMQPTEAKHVVVVELDDTISTVSPTNVVLYIYTNSAYTQSITNVAVTVTRRIVAHQ